MKTQIYVVGCGKPCDAVKENIRHNVVFFLSYVHMCLFERVGTGHEMRPYF